MDMSGLKDAAVSLERYSHGGDVFTGEGIGGVADQQTGLTHSPEEEEGGRKESRRQVQQKEGLCFQLQLKVCFCIGVRLGAASHSCCATQTLAYIHVARGTQKPLMIATSLH